jgi:hypothetical protein
MSLINDALKRASRQQKAAEANRPADGGVQLTAANAGGESRPNIAGIGIVLFCLLAGGWFYMKCKSDRAPKAVPGKVAVGTNAVARAATTSTNKPAPAKSPTIGQTYSNAMASARNVTANVLKAQNDAGPMVAEKTNAPPVATNFPPPTLATPPPTSPAQPVQAAAEPVPPPAPVGPFPKLKLQGIFYRLNGATALINNETVQVGSELEGAKVVSISRLEVKVDFHGQTKVLGLP